MVLSIPWVQPSHACGWNRDSLGEFPLPSIAPPDQPLPWGQILAAGAGKEALYVLVLPPSSIQLQS